MSDHAADAGEGRKLPVLSEERREFPKRDREPVLQELDANGDVIFRFKLGAPRGDATLEAHYRESVRDLLKVVRLFWRGKPVLVDAFAFLNAPNDPIPLLDAGEAPGRDEGG